MHPNEKEALMPLELPTVELADGADSVKKQGSDRNPEFLPPQITNTDQPVSNPMPPVPQEPPASAATTPPQITATPTSTNTRLAVQTPQIADDTDLIEKEWVEKAKEIVEKTKENPYLQNKAISEIKADYIKKRYNKDIAKSNE